MSKKLTFEEMYGLAKQVKLWGVVLRDTNDVINPKDAVYRGYVGEILVRITDDPHISAHYQNVSLGKEEDRDNKLRRLRSQIYKKRESQSQTMIGSFRNKGRSLARKLLNSQYLGINWFCGC